MNFQNLNFDYVEQPRPSLQNLAGLRPESSHSDATLRAFEDKQNQDFGYASTQTATPSPPPTVAPHAPTPPSLFSSSDTEIYGPDRLGGPTVIAQTYARPVVVQGPTPPTPSHQLQPPAWEASFNAAMLTDFRDDMARMAGAVTPGVDDTPYIQYAIEALTRDRDTGYSGEASTPSEVDVPVSQFYDPRQGYQNLQPPQAQWQPPMPPVTGQHSASVPIPVPVPLPMPYPSHPQPALVSEGQGLLEPFRPNAAASADSLASTLLKGGHRPAQPHEWATVDRDTIAARIGEQKAQRLPPLNFKPLALRTASLLGFAVLCLLMTGALIFCAVYSNLHDGLMAYVSIYGGQYFLFRMFPALLAAAILLYAQFIVATMFRIIPFARLASDEPDEREGAIFHDLYLESFLWPRLVGPWQVWVPTFVAWLMNITIPLHSSLFTVIWVEGAWRWATVQGVAWTLVALYLALFVSTIIVWRYWATMKTTGLMWDPRSLADITAIISDTNTTEDYRGTQIAGTREGIRFALRRQTNLTLGYWTWRDGRPGFWYTLGTPSDNTSSAPVLDQLGGKGAIKHQDKEKQAMMGSRGELFSDDHDHDHDMEMSPHARHRYLPWCLRSNQLLYFTITSFVLLLALLLVCFLPSTRITVGFLPALPSAPGRGDFSPADFLYAFIPSLLGTLMFLLFQSLDLSLRILQPWAALSANYPHGASAEQSLLADYAACAPLQSTLHAFINSHWRVAALSLLSTTFILIPVLAGGTFMALTTPTGTVRMYPNIPALAITLTLLILYFFALVSVFPRRRDFRLPHGVTCLAEIISFLANEDLLNDLSFKQCRSREEMLAKMGVGRGVSETRPRWLFGGDGGGEIVLGVRRARRFTEKRKVRKSQIRRGTGAARGFLV